MRPDRSCSPDSLFDEAHSPVSTSAPASPTSSGSRPRPASRRTPPIPGLYIFPGLLDRSIREEALEALEQGPLGVVIPRYSASSPDDHNAAHAGASADRALPRPNQYMFFATAPPGPSPTPTSSPLPPPLSDLLAHLAGLTAPLLPSSVHALAFAQPRARQAILNLYAPGEGIKAHVDLPGRYEDGVVGVSLEGGAVMDFARVRVREGAMSEAGERAGRGVPLGPEGEEEQEGREDQDEHHVYVQEGTVYLLSGEARWGWTHGIEGRETDEVYLDVEEHELRQGDRSTEVLRRQTRVSVTYRYMKPGADVVGPTVPGAESLDPEDVGDGSVGGDDVRHAAPS